MNTKSQFAQNDKVPVPLEVHYEVFKDIEQKIHRFLDHTASRFLMIGLRVAYDELDSSNEPDVMPYVVEAGYLSLIDYTIDCVPPDEETAEKPAEETWSFPLPLSVMNELYNEARDRLEEAAGVDLSVGVFYVFKGSNAQGGGVRCSCRGQRGKRQIITVDPVTGKKTKTCVDGCK